MSDSQLPQPPRKKPELTPEEKRRQFLIRVGVWIVVGGIGLYLVISGIVGIIAKG
ncbi:MAG: hypothetical protein M3N46_03635 [Actinomycetota bacterium]|nr:hypothetical protein [Actinomycetota bacterium]